MSSCKNRQHEDVLLRKVVELDVKWGVEDVSMRKVVLKETSRDVELDVKWRIVVQKSSTRGRVEGVLMRKVVELDVKWRVAQKCQQDDDLMCKFDLKKTSCDDELDVEWRVVA